MWPFSTGLTVYIYYVFLPFQINLWLEDSKCDQEEAMLHSKKQISVEWLKALFFISFKTHVNKISNLSLINEMTNNHLRKFVYGTWVSHIKILSDFSNVSYKDYTFTPDLTDDLLFRIKVVLINYSLGNN